MSSLMLLLTPGMVESHNAAAGPSYVSLYLSGNMFGSQLLHHSVLFSQCSNHTANL